PAGTPVYAPLDGVVERRENRDRRGDYGGLLVVRHETDRGEPFWTLHGHLDPSTLADGTVKAGEEIARLGAPEVNGGWRPHIAERRRTVMSRALSLAYDEPLHIVRGEGAYLIDADGRAFLDLVNNV